MAKNIVIATLLFLIAVAGIYIALGMGGSANRSGHGQFIGRVLAEWDVNGRDMTLNEDFAYVDPVDRIWLAPTGSVVNGASIPRAFWTLIGGPFEGKYRNASVIHDVACVEKKRSHEEVHRAFFDACRCGGVDLRMSRILYAAVAKFGPKWTYETVEEEKTITVTKYVLKEETRTVIDPVTGEEKTETYTVRLPVMETMVKKVIAKRPVEVFGDDPTEADVQELIKMIDEENPSIDQISALGGLPLSGDPVPVPIDPPTFEDNSDPAPAPVVPPGLEEEFRPAPVPE